MSRLILFIAVAVTALSSCSAYRSGETTQTPDDVYYSPARPGAAYVEVEKKQDNGYYRGNANDYYSSDDNWLRMRSRSLYRDRWSSFNDYDWNDWRYSSFAYSPYSYSPYYFNSYWNSCYTWNSYYNPYYTKIIVLNPSANQPVYSKVRTFALGSYTNTNYNNTNRPLGTKSFMRSSTPGYNNSNSNSNNSLGSSIRKVFSGNNSNSNGTYYNTSSSSSSDRPVRSYTPSNSSSSQSSSSAPARSSSGSSSGGSSSGSSGSSGGGAGSRPGRGN